MVGAIEPVRSVSSKAVAQGRSLASAVTSTVHKAKEVIVRRASQEAPAVAAAPTSRVAEKMPAPKPRRARGRTDVMSPASPGDEPESLKDPLADRAVQSVPLPRAQKFTHSCLFGERDEEAALAKFQRGEAALDLANLRKHLDAEGLLTQELLLALIANARAELQSEPNVLKLKDPITVVGDIHGQYYDLSTILELGASGANSEDPQYVFLGDYVDRGSFSMEVVIYLIALKCASPRRIWLLRGNHESRVMTQHFNFRQECEHKYDSTVYEAIMDMFDTLPLAAVINGQFLAVHGGLSPFCESLKDISKLTRTCEPPEDGLFCDLLWSDPAPSTAKGPKEWKKNTNRRCAWYFSSVATQKFLKQNDLLCVIRAHEVQLHGYKVHETNAKTGFPTCITVFSAPNYCDTYGNQGAVVQLNNSTLNVLQFNYVLHPFHLPGFMGLFEWSIPYLAQKVLSVFEALVTHGCEEHANRKITAVEDDLGADGASLDRRNSLSSDQNKVLHLVRQLGGLNIPEAPPGDTEQAAEGRMKKRAWALARMAKMMKDWTDENDKYVALHVCPGAGLTHSAILEAQKKVRAKSEADLFCMSSKLDVENEMRPRSGSSPNAAVA